MLKFLAYSLAQGMKITIVIHNFAVPHGDVLSEVVFFQSCVLVTVRGSLFGDFAAIQFPNVTTKSRFKHLGKRGVFSPGNRFDTFIQIGVYGYGGHFISG